MIACACGFTADSITAVLDHQDACHPERRAARTYALAGLRAALSAPLKPPKEPVDATTRTALRNF